MEPTRGLGAQGARWKGESSPVTKSSQGWEVGAGDGGEAWGRKSDTPEGAGGSRGPGLRRASSLVSDRVEAGGEFLSLWTTARE